MDIFESLENLNVSEECFDEIMDMVEELLSEDTVSYLDKKQEGKPYTPEYWNLRSKAENAKKKGQEATEKKELERIKANKTRKDIHPSVLKKQQERDEVIKNFAQKKTRTYLDGETNSDNESAKAIAQARAEGRENKRTIGLDKTLNKQKPVSWTDYGRTEVGGGDPSKETLVRKVNDPDNYPYGNSNVNAEDNIRKR